MRPYVEEFRRIQALARATGWSPHRWTLDPHVRKGVRVADLFMAAMAVVGLALAGLRPPFWFYPLFLVPVLLFAGTLCVVVAAQSRDEERIRELRARK